MKKQSLKNTNPYFKDRAEREMFLEHSVKSSSAVEGIIVNLTAKPHPVPSKKSKAAYQRIKARLSK